MSTHDREPIVEDGDINLGRHATLFHIALGPLDRDVRIEPTDGVRFRVSDVPFDHPRDVFVWYDAEGLAAAWEDTLFESPLHADEVQAEEQS